MKWRLKEAFGGDSEFTEDFSALRERSLPHEAERIGKANGTSDAIVGGEANPGALPEECVLVDFRALMVAGFDQCNLAHLLLMLSVYCKYVGA